MLYITTVNYDQTLLDRLVHAYHSALNCLHCFAVSRSSAKSANYSTCVSV